jgi:predicted transcriptional regulator
MQKQDITIQDKENVINLAERFEVAFNQIHEVLKRINPYEYSDAFMKLLTDSSRKHRSIQRFYYELRQFAKLRNALVHDRVKIHTYIATPSLESVLLIEKISKLLSTPPSVTSIATRSVVSVQLDTTIEQVIKIMAQSSYNQFPVYEDGAFVFLLTEGGLTSWLASSIKNELISFTGKKVSCIQKYENDHNVAFVHRQTDIFELEDIFEESFQNHRKLEAVIVTENGSPLEKPLGIITPWDLIEIDLLRLQG